MAQQNKIRRSKRLEKKRQYKERRISERLKYKKLVCEYCNKCHKNQENVRFLKEVLNVMQNKGQIHKDAYFEVNEEDEEGGVFIRDPTLFDEDYYKYMKETYG